MRNIIVMLLIGWLALPTFAQQKEAKEVLDKTSAAFRKAGGVEAAFAIAIQANGKMQGTFDGTFRLKGDKFVVKTAGATTWFDGETQWSYLTDSEEVNISNPTEEELQSINPYALLSIYEQGFSYVLGKTRTYQGKSIHEVVLTATDKKKDIAKLVLYIAKDSYQPLYILVGMKDGSQNEIKITNYRAGKTFDDSLFVFDKKQYPRAEVIDLR